MSYRSKLEASFNTKWDLFLFDCALYDKASGLDSFKAFNINQEIIDLYTTRYKQYYLSETILDNESARVTKVHEKLEGLKEDLCRADYLDLYRETFGDILSEDQYNELIKIEECFYCELNKSDYDKLYEKHLIRKKANRGFNFEIDRKNPNEEYHYENLVMACYWCNNAKTDEFNAEEFKPIGMTIGKALLKRLEMKNGH